MYESSKTTYLPACPLPRKISYFSTFRDWPVSFARYQVGQALGPVLHRLDGFGGGPDRVREVCVVDERGSITVAPFGMLWRGRRIFHNRHLETLLQQFAQVRFDAHVG